jgi:flavin reductase (DIM6/NTAB) family NADH-FMN oxidoreductase RutF/DNA-binding IclR family transcriptional regulator
MNRASPSDDRGAAGSDPRDSVWFRSVLGQFPTGVVIVTAVTPDGPTGMTVGSFTSVSLDPPLVAFLPAVRSATFAKIEAAGRFCVNVLAADQADLCRQFGRKDTKRFEDVDYDLSPVSGSPRLAGSVAWIDCTLHEVSRVGDHLFVVADVEDLGLRADTNPLLFRQGGYGRFASISLSAIGDAATVGLMRQVEAIRPLMERVAAELDMEATVVARYGNDMHVIASARTAEVHGVPTRVGQRLPMAPPLGALLVASEGTSVRQRWLEEIPSGGAPRKDYEALLERVRDRGWSVGLMSESIARFDRVVNEMTVNSVDEDELGRLRAAAADLRIEDSDPEALDEVLERPVRYVAAPVAAGDRSVVWMLSLVRVQPMSVDELERTRDEVVAVAAEMSRELTRLGPAASA